ncbi:hypothetical protein NDU88_002594 [Pleurodeles waltl]|uniref:Uncharacterized protein n=1 Tax=Pleurodeles waltl TaxID=8319 RepID=A0AAV7VAZ3_PLEWA|nr:hypothetical protein NDU88_002594 [Pleurodeles waltl]
MVDRYSVSPDAGARRALPSTPDTLVSGKTLRLKPEGAALFPQQGLYRRGAPHVLRCSAADSSTGAQVQDAGRVPKALHIGILSSSEGRPRGRGNATPPSG